MPLLKVSTKGKHVFVYMCVSVCKDMCKYILIVS